MRISLSSFTRRTRAFWWSLTLATIAALLFTACGGATTTATSTPTPAPTATATTPPTPTATPTIVNVKITEAGDNKYAFQPATLTIKAGTQVVWTNTSDAPHTVTSDQAGVFGTTSNLTKTQTFSFTFTTAGTFAYHCAIHPYMKATITVTS